MPFPLKFNKLKTTLSGSRDFGIVFCGYFLAFAFFIALILTETSNRITTYSSKEEPPKGTKPNEFISQNIKTKTNLLASEAEKEPIDSTTQSIPPKDSKQI